MQAAPDQRTSAQTHPVKSPHECRECSMKAVWPGWRCSVHARHSREMFSSLVDNGILGGNSSLRRYPLEG